VNRVRERIGLKCMINIEQADLLSRRFLWDVTPWNLVCFKRTELVGSNSNASGLYLGGIWFESRSGTRLSCLRIFMVFLSTSRQIPCQYLKLRRDHFPPHPLQLFIIIQSFRPHFIFFISWGGVRLSPLGTWATNWSIVPPPDYSRVWTIWWNKKW
jgi:hypothetical protein